MDNNPKLVSTHDKKDLLNKAYEMVMRGWSVIPLRGASDLAKPKAPALPAWRDYQTRKPRLPELERWFMENGYGAMGVVLGRVSGIVVIDIDKPEIETAFRNSLPHLVNTYTVRSGNRKLPHYYYSIPDGLDVPARTGQGIEFRSDGQYVVAPNTVIGDSVWRVENPFAPLTLSSDDLRAIYAFLGLYTRKASKTPLETPLNPEKSHIINPPTPPKTEILTVDGLRRWYIENARIYGRNNALFAGGCYARDLGWNLAQVTGALMGTHLTQPPNGDHIVETTAQRMDEARRTLDSVFKHPAKPRQKRTRVMGVPNNVRERLLQMGLDNTARVLEGLFLAGFPADKRFTAIEACAILGEMGIGKNAVYTGLGAVMENGQTVFSVSLTTQASIPLPPPPLHPYAIADKDKSLSPPQCLSGRGTNAGKNRGRPVRHFVMPSIESLCQRLGVTDMGSDPISRDDLRSTSAYRLALHKALIARAPKHYGRDWQARRLGINKKTARRYDKKAGIMGMPTFITKPIGWMNCEKECPDDVEYGVFVTDETGKRHPAKRRMVQKLLAQKHTLTLHRQTANYYFIPDVHGVSGDVPMADVSSIQPLSPIPTPSDYKQKWAQALERAMSKMSASDIPVIPRSMPRLMSEQLGLGRAYPQAEVVTVSTELGQYTLPLPSPKRRVQQPTSGTSPSPDKRGLSADELVYAERLYTCLREMNPDKGITKNLARQWIKDYGIGAIERGLNTLKHKTDVRNPSGYLRTLLRVEARLQCKT